MMRKGRPVEHLYYCYRVGGWSWGVGLEECKNVRECRCQNCNPTVVSINWITLIANERERERERETTDGVTVIPYGEEGEYHHQCPLVNQKTNQKVERGGDRVVTN